MHNVYFAPFLHSAYQIKQDQETIGQNNKHTFFMNQDARLPQYALLHFPFDFIDTQCIELYAAVRKYDNRELSYIAREDKDLRTLKSKVYKLATFQMKSAKFILRNSCFEGFFDLVQVALFHPNLAKFILKTPDLIKKLSSQQLGLILSVHPESLEMIESLIENVRAKIPQGYQYGNADDQQRQASETYDFLIDRLFHTALLSITHAKLILGKPILEGYLKVTGHGGKLMNMMGRSEQNSQGFNIDLSSTFEDDGHSDVLTMFEQELKAKIAVKKSEIDGCCYFGGVAPYTDLASYLNLDDHDDLNTDGLDDSNNQNDSYGTSNALSS